MILLPRPNRMRRMLGPKRDGRDPRSHRPCWERRSSASEMSHGLYPLALTGRTRETFGQFGFPSLEDQTKTNTHTQVCFVQGTLCLWSFQENLLWVPMPTRPRPRSSRNCCAAAAIAFRHFQRQPNKAHISSPSTKIAKHNCAAPAKSLTVRGSNGRPPLNPKKQKNN